MGIDQVFKTEDQVAKCLGYSRRAMRKWRTAGSGPPYFRVGRSIRYRMRDVEMWMGLHFVRTPKAAATLSNDLQAAKSESCSVLRR
jgi:hypothetical protein